MDIKEKLSRCLNVNKALISKGESESCLWPTLVGSTGVGKSRAVRVLAREMGKEMVTLILSHTLPEDIGGVLRVVDESAKWILPDWAHKECVLFMDEIDKAPRDVIAAVLSMITARELRGNKLNEGIIFVAAMQPPEWDPNTDETMSALVARMFLIGVPEHNGYSWVGQYGLEIPRWCQHTVDLPYLNRVSPRQARWIIEAAEIYGTELDWALEGIVSPRNREAVKRWVEHSPISITAWMRAFVEAPEMVKALTIPEIVRLAAALVEFGDERALKPFCQCVEQIAADAGEDEVRAFTGGITLALDRKSGGQNEVTVFGSLSEEEVADAISAAIAAGGMRRARRIENENK